MSNFPPISVRPQKYQQYHTRTVDERLTQGRAYIRSFEPYDLRCHLLSGRAHVSEVTSREMTGGKRLEQQ